MLINYHALSLVLLCLVASPPGYAAVPTDFGPLGDGSSIVWSLTPLNKGDVIEVHAFKAEPGTMVFLAICNDTCDDPHVVKSISVYRAQINVVTERYALEESGHLVFWSALPPRPDFNPGASRAISDDSRNQVAGVLHSGFTGLYNDAQALRISKTEFDPDRVKVRFDGGRYVTVSRISAASQTDPSAEHR